MANIISALPSKHEAVLKATYDDLIAFGKVFLGGDFNKSESPWFHYEIGDELISESNKPCAIIISRGHAKTTLIKAKVIRDFCFSHTAKSLGLRDYDLSIFDGWVSSNQRKSKNNIAYVKMHLKYNDKLKFYFGEKLSNLKVDNQEDLVTGYGDRILSSSNLTSMRGDTLATIERGAVRYFNVFVDDAENEDNTRTPLSRDKISDNIMNGILPAIEKNTPGARLFLVDTPVHYDCFAQNIIDKWAHIKDDPELEKEFTWKVIHYPVSQPDRPGGVLWQSYMPREKLDEIKKTYEDSPKGVSGYYQEYELEVQSSENALWTRDHIKYHNGVYQYIDGISYLNIEGEQVPINTFIGCDPATDIDTKHSDYSVIMAIGVDEMSNIYVLEYERHRSIPTVGLRNDKGEIEGKKGVVDYIIDMYRKYHCKSGTVEDVAMTRSVFQSLNQQRKTLNAWDVAIIPEPAAGRNKINKIYSGLASKFASGQIHLREAHFDLINEIIKFSGKMAHDDTIETLYFACRYAYPPKYQREASTGKVQHIKRKAKPWVVA